LVNASKTPGLPEKFLSEQQFMTSTMLYFDNFAIGARFEAGHLEVTAEEIKAFASRFDPQPFHTDAAAAENSFFHGLAASGWHTAAMTMRMMVEALPVAGGLIGAGVDEIRWPRATRPGDVLRIEIEVIERRLMKSRENTGLVKIRTTTFNQKGEVVQTVQPNIVVPVSRPGG
jgi:acyl dehydratase